MEGHPYRATNGGQATRREEVDPEADASARIQILQERVSHLLFELRERNRERDAWLHHSRQLEERNRVLETQVREAETLAAPSALEETENEALLATLKRTLETKRAPSARMATYWGELSPQGGGGEPVPFAQVMSPKTLSRLGVPFA